MLRVNRYDFPVGSSVSMNLAKSAKIIGLDGHVDSKPVLWVEEDSLDTIVQRHFKSVQPLWPVPMNHVSYLGRYRFNFIVMNVYEVDAP